MDRTHNPEFTVMEIYVSYKDYNWMMRFTEEMIEHVATQALGTTDVQFGDKSISFKAPFARVSMTDAILQHTGFDITGKTEAELRAKCIELGLEANENFGKGKLIDTLFGEMCEKHFIQPTFITDYPVEMSPLCKRHRDNPELTERFELMVNGKELANAYSELNDPIDQRERFEEQIKLMERGDDEAMFIDYDFLRALEYGMPPTSGMGIGIDRLVMMMTNNESIQEVLFFPQMRPEKKQEGPDLAAFENIGIPAYWIEALVSLGIHTLEQLKEVKPTALHQNLNTYRKKNKLDIPAAQLDEILTWIN
jgi:lysyl-tRNA synthetase class 2